jgi:hypothetical protein
MNLKKLIALPAIPLLAISMAACGSEEKPSKDAVASGLKTLLSAELESYGADVSSLIDDSVYTCVADEIYDDISAAGLKAIAEADTEAEVFESGDQQKIEEALTQCATSSVQSGQ